MPYIGNPEQSFVSYGVADSQQFTISSILLILNDTSSVDIKFATEELVFYEDIFSPAASGYVLITDASGWIENLNINGFNKVQVTFSKVGSDDPNAFKRLFRVYKIGERYQISRSKEKYALHFCSEELIINEQIKIVRSYPNTQISTIIYSILTGDLGAPGPGESITKIGTIEDTSGYYSFIIPNIKPFEAFSWLSTYAQPSDKRYIGADMLFYENRNGYNFRSLQSIMNDPVYNTYNYSPKNISGVSLGFSLSGIISYKFTNTFDLLKTVSSGGYANKLLSLDPLLRQTKTTEFNYDNYAGSKLNKYGTSSPQTNRFGKTVSSTSSAVYKVATSNKNQLTSLNITSNATGLSSVVPDIAIDVYIPNRTAQMSMINQIKIEFSIPGDPGLSVGRVVKLNIPSLSYDGNENSLNLDKYFTAKYIISKVKHVMDNKGIYNCVCEAITDSTSNPVLAGNINSSLSSKLNNQ